jgi:hypothetical protein
MRIRSFLLFFPIVVLLAQRPERTLDGDVIDSVTGAPVAAARVKLAAGNADPMYRTAPRTRGVTSTSITCPGQQGPPTDPFFLGFDEYRVTRTTGPLRHTQ